MPGDAAASDASGPDARPPADAAVEASAADAASGGDGGTCLGRPHPLDGTSLSVTINGGSATVTPRAGGAWTCSVLGPNSSPGSGPDGSTVQATGCYLLLLCGDQTLPGEGGEMVQIEILPQGTPDVLVTARDTSGGACCTDEYTGHWQ
jgi:hypothetical protein